MVADSVQNENKTNNETAAIMRDTTHCNLRNADVVFENACVPTATFRSDAHITEMCAERYIIRGSSAMPGHFNARLAKNDDMVLMVTIDGRAKGRGTAPDSDAKADVGIQLKRIDK